MYEPVQDRDHPALQTPRHELSGNVFVPKETSIEAQEDGRESRRGRRRRRGSRRRSRRSLFLRETLVRVGEVARWAVIQAASVEEVLEQFEVSFFHTPVRFGEDQRARDREDGTLLDQENFAPFQDSDTLNFRCTNKVATREKADDTQNLANLRNGYEDNQRKKYRERRKKNQNVNEPKR